MLLLAILILAIIALGIPYGARQYGWGAGPGFGVGGLIVVLLLIYLFTHGL